MTSNDPRCSDCYEVDKRIIKTLIGPLWCVTYLCENRSTHGQFPGVKYQHSVVTGPAEGAHNA